MENYGPLLSCIPEDSGRYDSGCHQKDTYCSDTLVSLTDPVCSETMENKVSKERGQQTECTASHGHSCASHTNDWFRLHMSTAGCCREKARRSRALNIQRAGKSYLFKLRDVRGAFTSVTHKSERYAQIGNAASGGNAEGTTSGHPPQPACQQCCERLGVVIGKLQRVQGKEISGVTSFSEFTTFHSMHVSSRMSAEFC